MLESTSASWIADTLFGPIESRDRAEDLARVLGITVLGLALTEAGLAAFVGRWALAVAVLDAAFGVLVWWRKSVAAAIGLLAVVLGTSVWSTYAVLRQESASAVWALVISLVGVWAGGRAVHCVLQLRRLTSPPPKPLEERA
jgi:hypothetical protein